MELVYLTNACGEVTHNGSLIVEEEDFMKVPFEQGPQSLLTYIVEYGNKKCMAAVCEMPYDDPFWGEEGDGFPTKEYVMEVAVVLCAYLASRNVHKNMVLLQSATTPGRVEVIALVPLTALTGRYSTLSLLRWLFWNYLEKYHVYAGVDLQGSTTDLAEAKRWADEYNEAGLNSAYVVDSTGKRIHPPEALVERPGEPKGYPTFTDALMGGLSTRHGNAHPVSPYTITEIYVHFGREAATTRYQVCINDIPFDIVEVVKGGNRQYSVQDPLTYTE